MRNLICISLVILCVFNSCTSKNTNSGTVQAKDSLQLIYAEGFAIKYYSDFKELIVYSPWIKGSVYAKYYLVNDKKIQTPGDGIKVKVPIQTIAATSVTHFEFLSLLGELQTITAVCSPDIIYNQEINERVGEGQIISLGDAFNINLEQTMKLHPDAVMMSGYNQNDPYAQRVTQAGIPVVFNNEWMETSLMARAEWMKFVAAFYNKEQLADSIFKLIDKQYTDIKTIVANVNNKPNIMIGSNFRGTWYMPSGENFMGKLFADAGSEYFYAKDTTVGSLPLNVETVIKNFSNADIWLGCNFNSIDELIKADSKHGLFKPVKLKKVYSFNKRLLASSANDFWESAVARPDLLLKDVIAVLHPEILPDYQFVYIKKLD